MPDERNYYVICDDNCKFPGMTAEQILAAIAEATGETPTHIEDAFITKIKEQNKQGTLKFWRGTSAEYNAISEKDNNCFYIITDDSTKADFEAEFQSIHAAQESMGGSLTGAVMALSSLQHDLDNTDSRVDGIENSLVKTPVTITPIPALPNHGVGEVESEIISSACFYNPALKMVFFEAAIKIKESTNGTVTIAKFPTKYDPFIAKSDESATQIPIYCIWSGKVVPTFAGFGKITINVSNVAQFISANEIFYVNASWICE